MNSIVKPPLPTPLLEHVQIKLASNSPRRRELLGMILPSFEIAECREVDENYPSDLPAEQVPIYLSQVKASAYTNELKTNDLIITADTVVINNRTILGKPVDRLQAIAMLQDLSGHTHTVVTGVTLTTLKTTISFSESTQVTFAQLTEKEISKYVDTYRPYDKAGAYGIQEWIGAAAITSIKGCYYNVMGLPLHALYTNLQQLAF